MERAALTPRTRVSFKNIDKIRNYALFSNGAHYFYEIRIDRIFEFIFQENDHRKEAEFHGARVRKRQITSLASLFSRATSCFRSS